MDGQKGEMVSIGMSQTHLPVRFFTTLQLCRALLWARVNELCRLHFSALQILQQQKHREHFKPKCWALDMGLLPKCTSSWDNCCEPCGLPAGLYKTSLGKHHILGQHILSCVCHGRLRAKQYSVQCFSTEGQCSAF